MEYSRTSTHTELSTRSNSTRPCSVRSWVAVRVLNETPADKGCALRPCSMDGALSSSRLNALATATAIGRGELTTTFTWTSAALYVILTSERRLRRLWPRRPPPATPRNASRAGPVMFGRGPVRVDVMLDPLVGLDDATKPLRSRLLAVPALRARYLNYVRQIAERWLDWQRLEPVARLHHARIAEAVRADTRKLYTNQAFESGVSEGSESLKSFVSRRRAFLLQEK